jgi:hypothetical protein
MGKHFAKEIIIFRLTQKKQFQSQFGTKYLVTFRSYDLAFPSAKKSGTKQSFDVNRSVAIKS